MKKKKNIANHLIPAIVFLMIAFILMLILYFSSGDWQGSQRGLQLSVLSFTLISIFDLIFAVYELHKQTRERKEEAAVLPEEAEAIRPADGTAEQTEV